MGEYQLAGPEWLTLVRSVRSVSRSTFLVITTGGWTYTWNRINSRPSRWEVTVSDDGEETPEVLVQNLRAAVAATYGPWLPRFSPPSVGGFVTDWVGGVPAKVLQQLWEVLVKRLRTLGTLPKHDAWIWVAKQRVIGWNGWRAIRLSEIVLNGKPAQRWGPVSIWDEDGIDVPLMLEGDLLGVFIPGDQEWTKAEAVGVLLPDGTPAAAVKVLPGTPLVHQDSGKTHKVGPRSDGLPGARVITIAL